MGGTEFGLCLRLKNRLLNPYAQGAYQALTDVGRLVFLLVKLTHHAGVAFAESGLVRAAFGGMLSVDEGIEIVARLPVDMGESRLKVAVLDMDDGVEAFTFHVVLQKVEEAILGIIAFVVVNQAQTTVKVGVVPHALLDVFIHIVVVTKQRGIGDELGQCASVAIGWNDARITDHFALCKLHNPCLSLSDRLHLEIRRKRVDGLGSHTVQSDRLLEHLAVVFSTRIC